MFVHVASTLAGKVMRSRMVNRHSEFIASLAALRSAFGREGPDDQPAVRKACCRTMPQHHKKETKVVLIGRILPS